MIPALSDATFESLGIASALLENIKKLKWDHPTLIQQESIPVALTGASGCHVSVTRSLSFFFHFLISVPHRRP